MKENQYFKLLPNYSKKIGFSGIVSTVTLCILAFSFNWFESKNQLLMIEVAREVILLSLLIITVSQDKIEDEFVMYLRLKALVFAFVSGVLFSTLLPIYNYLLTGIHTHFIEANTILTFMFAAYFLMFFYLKRKR